jgi:hypothetical protein
MVTNMNQNTSRSGLVIYAKDFKRVASFHQNTLALDAIEQEQDYILLQGEGIEVVVLQIPEHISASITITDPPQIRDDTPIKPAFLVSSLAEVRIAVVETGGTLEPRDAAWRFQEMLVLDGTDPEGNVVQFRERIG